jgi:carotenoid cleavage dioxygenase
MHISSERTLLFDGLMRHDLQHGGTVTHWFGEGCCGSEAVFAPRPGATAEDDGYLVTFVRDQRAPGSEAQVFDATRLEAGPLARLRVPAPVPLGFHATWVPL